jgi:hypothetical protein
MEGNTFIKDGVGLATVDLDVVAEINKGLREVSGIDTLTADVWLSSVCEIGNA